MSKKWTTFALISTALGAGEAVVYKKMLGGMPFHEVAFVDSLCLAFLFACLGGWKIKDTSKKGLFYLLVGSLISGIGVFFYFLSLKHLSSIDFSFLGRNHILFSVLLAFFFLGERPNKRVWVAMVFAMLGAYFFTFSSLDSSTLIGVGCSLLFCTAYAVRGVFLKLGPPLETKAIMFWSSIFSVILTGAASLMMEESFDIDRAFLSSNFVILAITSWIAQGIGLSLYFKAIMNGQLASISSIRATNPFFVAVISLCLFSYTWTPFKVLGFAFCSISICLFVWDAWRAPTKLPKLQKS